VEIVRDVLEHFVATGTLTDDVAPDYVWDMTTFEGWLDQPVYHGHAGLLQFFASWMEQFDHWTQETERLVEVGDDRVLAIQRQQATAKASGMRIDMRYATIYTLAAGKVKRADSYATVAAAFESVGLAE
jgi:ketosteroid isomerase-like protein